MTSNFCGLADLSETEAYFGETKVLYTLSKGLLVEEMSGREHYRCFKCVQENTVVLIVL